MFVCLFAYFVVSFLGLKNTGVDNRFSETENIADFDQVCWTFGGKVYVLHAFW